MLILYFLISFVTVMLSVPVFMRIAYRFNIVDVPSENRKIHKGAKPYLGGAAVYLGCLVGYLAYTNFALGHTELSFWLYGGILVIVGIYDDINDMRAYKKLLWQFAIAFLTCLSIGGFSYMSIFGIEIYFSTFQAVFLQALWITVLINAFNLIDGLDGLSSGLAAISLSFMWLAMQMTGIVAGEIYVIIMIGSLLAFLYYNFFPSTIFLGDAGSMFIGYYIAVISLNQYKSFTITTTGILLLVAFIPLLDIILAMIRRKANKQGIFSADALHFHHRLLRRGLSHSQAVLSMYAIMTVYAVSALLITVYHGDVMYYILIFLVIFTELVIEYFYMLSDRFTIVRKTINKLKKRKNNG